MAKKIKIPKQRPDAERRERQTQKFGRLLKLLERIQGRGHWNVQNLAADLEVNERTIYRDLKVLELVGVPWYFDEQARCYRVNSWYQFPALNLSQDELLDQAAATVVANAPGIRAGRGTQAATQKIAAKSSEAAKRLLNEAQQIIGVLDLKLARNARQQEFLRVIQWAILNRKQVAGKYASPYKSTVAALTLHPYRLCLSRHAWYLIGKSTESAGPRTYRIARFESLRQIDRAAEIPAGFDLGAYFGDAWSVYRGSEAFDIELRFRPEAAQVVAETTWHHTQQAQKHSDGSVTLRFHVDGLEEIVWWLLSWAGMVRIVQPARLRTMFVEQLRQALADHADDLPSSGVAPAARSTRKSTGK